MYKPRVKKAPAFYSIEDRSAEELVRLWQYIDRLSRDYNKKFEELVRRCMNERIEKAAKQYKEEFGEDMPEEDRKALREAEENEYRKTLCLCQIVEEMRRPDFPNPKKEEHDDRRPIVF